MAVTKPGYQDPEPLYRAVPFLAEIYALCQNQAQIDAVTRIMAPPVFSTQAQRTAAKGIVRGLTGASNMSAKARDVHTVLTK